VGSGLMKAAELLVYLRDGAPWRDAYTKTKALLSHSVHGDRRSQCVVYLYSMLGVGLGIECDSPCIEALRYIDVWFDRCCRYLLIR